MSYNGPEAWEELEEQSSVEEAEAVEDTPVVPNTSEEAQKALKNFYNAVDSHELSPKNERQYQRRLYHLLVDQFLDDQDVKRINEMVAEIKEKVKKKPERVIEESKEVTEEVVTYPEEIVEEPKEVVVEEEVAKEEPQEIIEEPEEVVTYPEEIVEEPEEVVTYPEEIVEEPEEVAEEAEAMVIPEAPILDDQEVVLEETEDGNFSALISGIFPDPEHTEAIRFRINGGDWEEYHYDNEEEFEFEVNQPGEVEIRAVNLDDSEEDSEENDLESESVFVTVKEAEESNEIEIPAPLITQEVDIQCGDYCDRSITYPGSFKYVGDISDVSFDVSVTGGATPGEITNVQYDGETVTFDYDPSANAGGDQETISFTISNESGIATTEQTNWVL